jgi:hypothetical protein
LTGILYGGKLNASESFGEASMKKPILRVVAVLCVLVLCQQGLKAEFGVKAGLSLAKYQWTTPVPIGFEWGYLTFAAGGLYVEAGRGILSVQPGVFFTRMGGRYFVEGDSLEFRFDYIQAPVLLKMNILPSGSVCPFFAFGGYGAYLIKAQGVLVIDGERETENVIEDYERFDAGLVFSGGLDFQFARTTVSVECRYAHGLMEALKYPIEGESMKHRSIMALVGIGF